VIEQRDQQRRNNLRVAVKLFFFVLLLFILYTFTDYTFNSGAPIVNQSYRFELPDLQLDKPVILRQKNFSIVVIRRSEKTLSQLKLVSPGLLDSGSAQSNQPKFALNWHRSLQKIYFIAIAIGTDYGCPIKIENQYLRESCSDAFYDYSGRALKASRSYRNLTVPEYRFADDYNSVTITLQ